MVVPAVTLRVMAVPERLLSPTGRPAPCEGCEFVAPAPVCPVMRARMVQAGLPDCSGGYVYRLMREV